MFEQCSWLLSGLNNETVDPVILSMQLAGVRRKHTLLWSERRGADRRTWAKDELSRGLAPPVALSTQHFIVIRPLQRVVRRLVHCS